jgi:hypothetical protein
MTAWRASSEYLISIFALIVVSTVKVTFSLPARR